MYNFFLQIVRDEVLLHRNIQGDFYQHFIDQLSALVRDILVLGFHHEIPTYLCWQ